jgi:AraC-like DNA-binding protein/NAD(P)H-dependent FMN reductase
MDHYSNHKTGVMEGSAGGCRVLLVGGSIRRPSHTRCLLEAARRALVGMGAETITWDVAESESPPGAVRRTTTAGRAFGEAAGWAHAIVLATPLYHNSYSGLLKSALDNLGAGDLRGKPVGLMSSSAGANPQGVDHLRVVIRSLYGVAIPCQVIASDDEFDEVGGRYEIASPELQRQVEEFAAELVWFTSRLFQFAGQVLPRGDLDVGLEPAHPIAPSGGGRAARAEPGEQIARAVAFLRENFSRGDLSLSTVAREAYMSRYHFSRVFKRETGSRFIDVLTTLRLSEACTLLHQTNHSITDICYLVGYNQLSHFERSFKRLMGISPSEYRRCHREGRRAPQPFSPLKGLATFERALGGGSMLAIGEAAS